MAAYAALISLMNTMDHIQNHPRFPISLDKKQIESLHDRVAFLLDFIESSHSHGFSKEDEILESQIASAAHAAEDVIESHVVDQILAGSSEGHRRERSVPLIDVQEEKDDANSSTKETSSISLCGVRKVIKNIKRKAINPLYSTRLFCGLKKESLVEQIDTDYVFLLDLQTVIKDMDSVKEKVVIVKGERGFKNPQATSSTSATSSTPLISTGESTMVGFDDELLQLMDYLTGKESSLQIIPIVGMGGSGKTTLAKNVYAKFLNLRDFDACAWSTISQQLSVGEISLKLLFRQSTSTSDIGETEQQLALELYQSLCNRRYLIILDDIWSIEAWENIMHFFPDNNNRSRIIITTRLSDLAIHFGWKYLIKMSCLDESRCWKLFCHKAFGQEEGCPRELERIGKRIVDKCKGLPLSIVVIGGLLGKSNKTQEYWENFAIVNEHSVLMNLDILSLSYSHLPAHLKPCFLYLGIFPEDHEIHASRLIKLWVAEGFVKPNNTQSLEEVAEGYLKDLVDRNLILVGRLGWNGRIKSCNIHDLLRDLCLKIAQKEKFLNLIRFYDIPRDLDNQRRFVFHEYFWDYNLPKFHALVSSAPLTRSLVSQHGLPLFSKFRLLRVSNVAEVSLDDICKHVNLRYICKRYLWGLPAFHEHVLPSSISMLWNLQTLIIREGKKIVVPLEIWEMTQLRHVECVDMYLPEPPLSDLQDHDVVLRNLQTLGTAVNLRLSDEVCKRVPNVKKLKLMYDQFELNPHSYCLYNLWRLCKLESLSCSFKSMPNLTIIGNSLVYWYLLFPVSLKKLSLEGCYFHCYDLTLIGLLPNLEVLNLKDRSIRGPEWNLVHEGGFLRLKSLKISRNYLIYWNADSSHFPALEKLVLEDLIQLHEIPLSIGEIPTLLSIELYRCSDSAAASAMKILEEQESLGNDGLRVRVVTVDDEMRLFKENIKRWFGIYTV